MATKYPTANTLEIKKAANILSEIAYHYEIIQKKDFEIEKIKLDNNVERNLDAYLAFRDVETLNRCITLAQMATIAQLDFESQPIEDFYRYIFGDTSLDAKKLRTAIYLLNLLIDKQEHFSKIIAYEAELATICYVENIAYEIAAPIIQKELEYTQTYI